jgi:hypothetical protein
VSAHRAHRRARPTRTAGRVALSGAAVLALGAGPVVGIASAAPVAASTTAPSADAGAASDVLWYGLLTTAAVAGAAGAHQLAGGTRRRA